MERNVSGIFDLYKSYHEALVELIHLVSTSTPASRMSNPTMSTSGHVLVHSLALSYKYDCSQ